MSASVITRYIVIKIYLDRTDFSTPERRHQRIDDALQRQGDVDDGGILRFLQGVELALQQSGIEEMALPSGQSFGQQFRRAAQVNQLAFTPRIENAAIVRLQSGTGENMAGSAYADIADGVADGAQLGQAVCVGQGDAGGHFGAVGFRM